MQAKGNAARKHTGVIAQRIKKAFDDRGLSAETYGLLCYDEWDAVPDQVSIEKVIVKPAEYDKNENLISEEVVETIEHVIPGQEAGSAWSVRYDEALAMEAAYQRRRADRAEARLADIERRLSILEEK